MHFDDGALARLDDALVLVEAGFFDLAQRLPNRFDKFVVVV